MTVLVLGDQLTRSVGPLARRPDERVCLIEARAFAERLPYHPHKLILVFSAMRHFRDELRAAGRPVDYYQVETFADGFDKHFDRWPDDELVAMRPASHGGGERLQRLVDAADGTIEIVDNDLFLCSVEQFERWADEDEDPRHEEFYRFIRRETGYLMADGEPVGGQWNFDEDNRETPPPEYTPPDPPAFEPDAVTREVIEWVDSTFTGGYETPPYGGDWADPEPFRWPVTRSAALAALEDFIDNRLPEFGPYQDAMVADEWALNHALLSPAINLGLLHPAEVVERAIEAGTEREDIPLQSLEGFVRQLIGWREFVRHTYRRAMPALATANQLDADGDLPAFYWTGDTDMACLADAIDGVRRRGYSHHIQRLMVLSNFALLAGVRPAALNRWFHAAYTDAFHWVTTPNVVGMGMFGSDVLSTKPYAASANYIDRMGDYCAGCPYDPDATVGEDACPFNTLYWDFLDRNEDRLRSNHRMGLVYHHLDGKDDEELAAIRARAEDLRDRFGIDTDSIVDSGSMDGA
ncbi:MAG: cryptochrome/photolyase family protein [Halobacteriales archaeon]|nr:cryptochrome/photolyase family protein [Halobacteriales archaeon]